MVVWLHFSQFLELIILLQVLIVFGKSDIGADEPVRIKIESDVSENCWVSWAGEWELLWWVMILF